MVKTSAALAVILGTVLALTAPGALNAKTNAMKSGRDERGGGGGASIETLLLIALAIAVVLAVGIGIKAYVSKHLPT